MQFLSFKLSFNDYYIQDISNKIKSVKKKKMELGEYQAGIAPYGYKKDSKVKNHLVIDEQSYLVVQEIFDMYANQEMSTIKIAEELNRRNIMPPSIHMKMPITKASMNNKQNKKYLWSRTQIGNMLKNQTYLGYVVSGKKEQISPKIKKGYRKEKSEYIVVKNKHEPIISEEIWNKTQKKLKSYHRENKKRYEYLLKDLVYCGECGNKVVFQHNKSKNKEGKVYWEGNFAVCRNAKSHTGLHKNIVIREQILLNIVKEKIQKEIEKVTYTSEEMQEIYGNARKKVKDVDTTNQEKIENENKKIDKLKESISNLYEKKATKQILISEFKREYKKVSDEKVRMEKKVEQMKKIKEECKEEQIEHENINEIVNKFRQMDCFTNEMWKKLVKKIEFDTNKKITLELTFSER